MRNTLVGMLFAACVLTACDDDEIFVESVLQPIENRAPSIVLQEPAAGGSTVTDPSEFWIVVADPDGLDDISAVLFETESVIVHRTVFRLMEPDPFNPNCGILTWADDDTLDLAGLAVPSVTPGITGMGMTQIQPGMYEGPSFSIVPYSSPSPFLRQVMDALGAPFGPVVWSCGSGPLDMLSRAGIYPPAVPAPTDACLTYVELEITGIRATVYDAAGASAEASFPNVLVIGETQTEAQYLP